MNFLELRRTVITDSSFDVKKIERRCKEEQRAERIDKEMVKKTKAIISEEAIASKIIGVRGERIMLDRDLAEMYGVETRVLNQAVSRNIGRFPEDFMFTWP